MFWGNVNNASNNQQLFDYRLFCRLRFYDQFGTHACLITTKTKRTESIKSTENIKAELNVNI